MVNWKYEKQKNILTKVVGDSGSSNWEITFGFLVPEISKIFVEGDQRKVGSIGGIETCGTDNRIYRDDWAVRHLEAFWCYSFDFLVCHSNIWRCKCFEVAVALVFNQRKQWDTMITPTGVMRRHPTSKSGTRVCTVSPQIPDSIQVEVVGKYQA